MLSGILSAVLFIDAGALVQNLSNSILEITSAKTFFFDSTCQTKMHLLHLIQSNTSILINFMHCLQCDVRLFTIFSTLSLSQKISILTLQSSGLSPHVAKAAYRAKNSKNSMLGFSCCRNLTLHLPPIHLLL